MLIKCSFCGKNMNSLVYPKPCGPDDESRCFCCGVLIIQEPENTGQSSMAEEKS